MAEYSKESGGKPPLHLIPPEHLDVVACVLDYGRRKYYEWSWLDTPIPRYELIGAAMRHINAYNAGINYDNESGLHHLAHAITNLMFIFSYDYRGL